MIETANTTKLCVFCGRVPDEKTKEHILPKWLIDYTGVFNRTANLGMDLPHLYRTGEAKQRKFALSAFHFPACQECNSEFSKLESDTKVIMTKLFDNKPLDNIELTILLDWFDKVRMGLWLAFTRLDGFSDAINPRLHITARQRQKDRILFIYDLKDSSRKGLTFSGTNTPVFYQVPACFALLINSKLFINASADSLVSKNLGFAYGHLTGLEEESLHQMFHSVSGTGRSSYPVVGFSYASGATEIYQTVASRDLMLELEPGASDTFINDHYLNSNCLHACSTEQTKVSKIFFKELFANRIVALQEDEELDLKPTVPKSGPAAEEIIKKMISEMQVWFFRRRFPAGMLPEFKKQDLLLSQSETFKAQKVFLELEK